jgi:hypothetical protein
MKSTKVAYFPVLPAEQAILERLRQRDLVGRLDDVLGILDLVAEGHATPADVEQALTLYEETRELAPLDGRFDNLEGRLVDRIEKGLAEIEGRLARRLAGDGDPSSVVPSKLPARTRSEDPVSSEVPEGANLAFRIAGDLVWGSSASAFYTAVWAWLFDHGKVTAADLPIQGRGKKRYVVAADPVHPSGKDFYRAEEVHGAYIEVNLSRKDIIRRARHYLTLYDVPFEVVVGPV